MREGRAHRAACRFIRFQQQRQGAQDRRNAGQQDRAGQALAQGGFQQDHPQGRQIGIGHDLGRRQAQGCVLHQHGGKGAGKNRDIEDGDPDDRRQRPPGRRAQRAPSPEGRQDAARDQRAQAGDQRPLSPVQLADQGRIKGVQRAADQIDRLAPPDLQPHQGGRVAAKDHPQRPRTAQGKRQRQMAGHPLAQKPPAEPRRHDRGQGKDRAGGDGRGGL